MSAKRRTANELYALMRDAIQYMRSHPRERGSAAVARVVGMSPSRFDHAFAQWVGIAPKRFLSYLTKERAKELLSDRKNVLAVSRGAGLSGPSRLHDLLVVQDAVSPGEFKSGTIEIRYGIHASPFGWCVIGLTVRGICTLLFLESVAEHEAVKRIKAVWPKATLIRDDARVEPYAKKIFALAGKKSRIPLVLKGTNFQVKVWEALLAIPEGRVASYADIARSIGSPKAVRAVGSACAHNQITYLIPCHRVLTSGGGLGGYNGGVERKEVILAWEAARVE